MLVRLNWLDLERGRVVNFFIKQTRTSLSIYLSISSTGPEFEGAFVSLLQLFSSTKDNMSVLKRAFLRQNLPNIVNVIATFFVFAIVIYLKVGQILNCILRDLFYFHKCSPGNWISTYEFITVVFILKFCNI